MKLFRRRWGARQRRALREDGFVVLREAVPPARVEAALRLINGTLGSEGIPPGELPTFRARTFTPALTRHPALHALYQGTELSAVAEMAIGAGKVRAPGEAQIALRFPALDDGAAAVPHIDGISTPGNGVPPGTLLHFTALGGVFLSAVDGPAQGNFTVWPGSHHRIEAHLRAHGPAAFTDRFPELDLGPGTPIYAQPGDAVLAHYALAHGIAPNRGPHVRYAVFFRLYHADHEAHGSAPLTDLWMEWAGVRA